MLFEKRLLQRTDQSQRAPMQHINVARACCPPAWSGIPMARSIHFRTAVDERGAKFPILRRPQGASKILHLLPGMLHLNQVPIVRCKRDPKLKIYRNALKFKEATTGRLRKGLGCLRRPMHRCTRICEFTCRYDMLGCYPCPRVLLSLPSLGHAILIVSLLSGAQLRFRARAQEKCKAQKRNSPMCQSAHEKKTSQGLKPEIHQICNKDGLTS